MPTALRQTRDRERRELTHSSLLDAAQRTFIRKGYHATLISDIVGEAKVGQGTFYRNFPGKREIYLALLDRFVASLLAEFDGMRINLPITVEQYRDASVQALNRVTARVLQQPGVALLFLRDGPSIDREVEQRLDNVLDRFAGVAEFYLDYAIGQNLARPCDTRLISQALVGMGLRMLQLWLSGRLPREAVGKAAVELVDFAFQGFGLGPVPFESSRQQEKEKGDKS